MNKLEEARNNYITNIARSLDYDDKREFSIIVAKRYLEYAFSEDFAKIVDDQVYRELHPALKDLHNQYKETEALLKKEDKEK